MYELLPHLLNRTSRTELLYYTAPTTVLCARLTLLLHQTPKEHVHVEQDEEQWPNVEST
jgi:hypothetical protein